MSSAAKANGSPLNVLIVGAGIGGLCAGLALRQQGHSVTILESSRFSNETGAAIHIAPNCNGLLLRMGLDIETVGANELTGISMYIPSGKRVHHMDLKGPNDIWQHRWLLVHRAHLHTALRKRAVESAGPGTPCRLLLASKVVAIDPHEASTTLENGEKLVSDVILGADGVHKSECRKHLPEGEKFMPFDGGYSAFRFLVPIQELRDDPSTADLVGKPGNLSMNMATDRRIVYYPCVNNTMMNFLLIHPSSESKAKDGEWNLRGDKARMLEIGSCFAPEFQSLLAKAPEESLKIWTLLDMETLPTWTNDKMALLGDAAHPFLPHQAQGGAQAMEDAVSIAAVLPLGTIKSEIPERLKLYQKCRQDRANRIQHFTRLSGMSAEEQKKNNYKYDRKSDSM